MPVATNPATPSSACRTKGFMAHSRLFIQHFQIQWGIQRCHDQWSFFGFKSHFLDKSLPLGASDKTRLLLEGIFISERKCLAALP
jgi:hypothetical protein